MFQDSLRLPSFVQPLFCFAVAIIILIASWSSRACLADVLVQTVGNDIVILGDSQPNRVLIQFGIDFSTNTFGPEVVVDNDFSNSIKLGDFDIEEIFISLEGGDDSFLVRGVQFNSFVGSFGGGDDCVFFDESIGEISLDVDIVLGAGNDEVIFDQTETIHGNVNIEMNGGDDYLELSPLNIGGDFTCTTGAGSDSIRNDDFLSGVFAVFGNTRISTSGGNDTISLLTREAQDSSGGPIANVVFFGELELSLGGGNDMLNFEAGVGLDATINMGGGNDCMLISPSTLGLDATVFCGDVIIRGGGGSDELSFGNVLTTFFEKDFQFFGGRGRDSFTTSSMLVANGGFDVSLGLGNDNLDVDLNGSFAFPGTLNGGSGTDSLSPNSNALEDLGFSVLKFEN